MGARRRTIASGVVVAVAAVALVASLVSAGDPVTEVRQPAGTPQPAQRAESVVNLWMDPDGGACRRSEAPAPYADENACGTLDEAFQAADAGDVVLLTCGSAVCDFGSEPQVVRGANRDGSDHVTFRPASGREVRTGDVQFQAADGEEAIAPAHVTLDGEGRWTLADDFYVFPGGRDIAVRGVKAAKFYIRCGFDVTVAGSEFTDRIATAVPTISSAYGQAVPPAHARECGAGTPARDVVLRDNHFHEIWKPVGCSNAECHRECLHVQGVDGLVIAGNRFERCLGSTAAISFNIHDDSTIRRVIVERNHFEQTFEDIDDAGCDGPTDCAQRTGIGSVSTLHFSESTSGGCEVRVRENTFLRGGRHVTAGCAPVGAGVLVEHNSFDVAPGCDDAASAYTLRDNVARSGTWEPLCDDGGNRIAAG